ncbi:hypothetical protein [Burkholderia glumae]|uniref:hypothetical protein n=1 Tax=Burkholderia glumae TaxID=337 RepID=UPI0002D5D7B9|nr:hypothetical protein [Burkholderia glumae]PJO20597.1 hypothetical protein Y5A_023905 [Burkholderia glumae AU6208]QHE12808.1 hypothetical protein GQR88_21015 [Burkholderia glumae AU6208]
MPVNHPVDAFAYPLVSEIFGEAIRSAETLSLPGALVAHTCRDPGERFSVATRAAIYGALVPVTTRAFGADMTPYWRLRQEQGYFSRLREFTVIEDAAGQMVGWTGYSVIRADTCVTLYIDSTGMVPSHQSGGVMRQLLRARLRLAHAELKAGTTQLFAAARSESPIFYKLLRKVLGGSQLHPQVGASAPAAFLECGRRLAAWLGQAELLEPDSLVLRNAYTMVDELYGELPSTGDAELDRLFRDKLGPRDAYLLIGLMSDAIERD